MLGSVGSTRTRTEGLQGSCRNTRALGNTEANPECGICPLLNGLFGNSATEPPHGTISSPPYSTLFHQWKVERQKFGIYSQKSSRFMYTGFIQRSQTQEIQRFGRVNSRITEPQLCPRTKPKGNQREHKDKSSSSQNPLSQAKLRLLFTLSAWISLNYSLNS